MAVRHGYGKIAGADALVFVYDTGDTRNSYKGEPTENLFATTAMEFKDDYGVYTNNIESGTDSIGKYFIKDTVNAPWYTGLRIYQNGVYPLTAGVSYVVSFECRSPQSGWSWSYDSNASGGGWAGNDSGRASNTNLVFDKTGGITYTSDMVNTWQRVSYRVTMKDASVFTGASAYPHDSFFTNANNTKIYYRNAQLEVGKSHATQYVAGTRSATQGLLDLTGNSTIDISTVSFDSSALKLFDGTDDYISIASSNTITDYSQPFTMECVFMVDPAATWDNGYRSNIFSIGGSYAGMYGLFKYNNTDVGIQLRDADSTTYAVATNLSKGVYYHLVGTSDGTGTVSLYLNGTLTQDNTGTLTGAPDSQNLFIGGARAFGGAYGNHYQGEIPVAKYYNRALTAAEVKNNYNNYKGRFNI